MSSPVDLPYPDFLKLENDFTEEQKLIMQSVRQYITKEVEPSIAGHFEKETFPTEVIEKFGELGVFGANLDGYGLPGLDNTSYGLIMREIERCDSGLRSFASVQGALVMYPIHAYGSEEQKKHYLPKLASGEMIGCFGLTEEYGGSDPGAMNTRAELKSGKWVLNGSKMWITSGNLASIAIVWAKTDKGIRGFIVPTDTKGFSVKKMQGKLSLRASVTSELYFDNVEIPENSILPGSEGLKSALGCLSQARFGIAWGVIGAAESCFAEVCNYVKDRKVFGTSLASKQIVQLKLSKMLTKISLSQHLVNRLSKLKDQGEIHYSHISMAKQHNVEAALWCARTSRDILGGNGIMLEYKSMRHMCNLETVFTYEGTNDIHHLIIGSTITGVPAF